MKQWTVNENSYLLKLLRQGVPPALIAARMGLSAEEVTAHISHIDEFRQAVDPECPTELMCGAFLRISNDFNEMGNGLRTIAEVVSSAADPYDMHSLVLGELPTDIPEQVRQLVASQIVSKLLKAYAMFFIPASVQLEPIPEGDVCAEDYNNEEDED